MLDVFEVGEATEVSHDKWLVRGKAWQTIKVGDIVHCAVGRTYRLICNEDGIDSILVETDKPPVLQPFVVISISTYGREIEQIDRGITGDLIVKGEYGSLLQDTQLLVTL